MKKYVQLILVLVAALCFLMMAFYERKYAKLYTVLEYMPWPLHRSPNNTASCQTDDNFMSDQHWSESAPGIFVYSAFLLKDKSSVHIVALQRKTDQSNPVTCSFLHRDSSSIVKGYVRDYQLRQSGEWYLTIFVCALKKDKVNVPLNGVALLAPDATLERTLSVLAHTSNNNQKKRSRLVACVRPLPPGFADTTRLVEFIELQRSAGVDHMIFYHRGTGPTTQELFNQESHKGFTKVFSFDLPFNSPVDLLDSAAYSDCFLRSSTEANLTVIHLGMEDFFVTTDNRKLQDCLPRGFSGLVTFKTNFFCTDLRDDIIARTLHFPFLTLRKTKRLKKSVPQSLLVLETGPEAKMLKLLKTALDPLHLPNLPNTAAESKSGLFLNHYGTCGAKKIAKGVETDTRILKQKDKLFLALQPYVTT